MSSHLKFPAIIFLFAANFGCIPSEISNESLSEIYYYKEKFPGQSIHEIMGQDSEFKKLKTDKKSFKTSGKTEGNWFRLIIDGRLNNGKYFLTISHPGGHRKLDFYHDGKLIQSFGRFIPFDRKIVHYRHLVIPVNVAKDTIDKYYFRIEGEVFGYISISASRPEVFVNRILHEYYILGIFAGISLVMALYNFSLFIILRERVYFYYVFYTLMITVFLINEDGLFEFVFYPFDHFSKFFASILFGLLLPSSALLFAKSFLDLNKYNPILDKIITGVILFSPVFVLTGFFENRYAMIVLLNVNFLFVFSLVIAAIVSGLMHRQKQAIFILIAFSAMIFSGILRALLIVFPSEFSFLNPDWLAHGIKFGTSFELIVLSIGLADRYSSLREQYQQSRIHNLEERQKLNQEVHDTIGSELAGVLMQIRDKNVEPIIVEKLQRALDHARDITSLMNLAARTDRTFEEDIQDYINNFKGLKNFEFFHWFDPNLNDLPLKTRLNLFRIIQEWIGNCVRHGHAKKFNLKITKKKNCIVLKIQSDGNEFPWDSRKAVLSPGTGLRSIKFRTEKLKGRSRTFRLQNGNLFILRVPV